MDFIAKIENSQMSNIQDIAQALEKMGIEIKHVMPFIGVISGTSPKLSLRKLKIKGIESVQQDQQLRAY